MFVKKNCFQLKFNKKAHLILRQMGSYANHLYIILLL